MDSKKQTLTREIKFRGKRVDNNEWIEGYYVQLAGFDYIVPFNSAFRDILDADYEAAFEEVDSKTLSQWIGLKDNNGVNIFEGDILYYRYDDELEADGYGEVYNEVVFKDGAFGIMGEITNEFLSFSCNPIKTEVVAGNIHDKHKQKQALIDMMRGDEEIGLYDDNTKNH